VTVSSTTTFSKNAYFLSARSKPTMVWWWKPHFDHTYEFISKLNIKRVRCATIQISQNLDDHWRDNQRELTYNTNSLALWQTTLFFFFSFLVDAIKKWPYFSELHLENLLTNWKHLILKVFFNVVKTGVIIREKPQHTSQQARIYIWLYKTYITKLMEIK